MPSAVCPACETRFDPTLAACPACGAVPFRPPDDHPAVDWGAIDRRRKRRMRLGLVGGVLLGAAANAAHFAGGGNDRYAWLTAGLLMALGVAAGAGAGLIVAMAGELTPTRRYGDGNPPRGPQNPFAE